MAVRKMFEIILMAVMPAFALAIHARSQISSDRVTDFGHWGTMERCSGSSVAQGFQLKTEKYLRYGGDNTALNAIRLFCGDPFTGSTQTIKSSEGPWGDWGAINSCYPGVLTGFRLRTESYQGNSKGEDDTAANNVQFFCKRYQQLPEEILEGDGMNWGDWYPAKKCHSTQVICGIQTQVEPPVGREDDTALNRIRVECCNNKAGTCQLEHNVGLYT